MAALRWGILCAGKISFDFVSALGTLPKEEHTVTAVAARSQEKAKEFGEKFEIKRCYGSYEELVKDSEVDVIYVGSLNVTHKELSLLCLRHGKHVLCEKPIMMNSKELEEVLKVAKENNVFLMEVSLFSLNRFNIDLACFLVLRKSKDPLTKQLKYAFF